MPSNGCASPSTRPLECSFLLVIVRLGLRDFFVNVATLSAPGALNSYRDALCFSWG